MKESLVVMLGYGLGDINVLTAVDWSKNVFTNTNENYDFPIIQLLRKEEPKDDPYIDESDVIILEIESVDSFFNELNEYYPRYQENYDKVIGRISNYNSMFVECVETSIDEFINDNKKRLDIVHFISALPKEFSYIYTSYLTYLRAVIVTLDKLAEPNGAFEAYNQKLVVILDIFENVEINKMPTSFFAYIADVFDGVAYYVGYSDGKSWSAKRTWDARKIKLPKETVKELKCYCKANSCGMKYNLFSLINEIK